MRLFNVRSAVFSACRASCRGQILTRWSKQPGIVSTAACSLSWPMVSPSSLLAAPSVLLTSHATVGCSTGYMSGLRNDWPALVAAAAQTSGFAVELSALSEDELPGLLAYLRNASGLPFRFVSVHGPSKARRMPDGELAELLHRLPSWVSSIVMHPNSMDDLSPYAVLGRRLCIENMDARKDVGQTADDLRPFFEALPEARLCFDVAHAKAVDPTMAVGGQLLTEYSFRLSHVHLSSLDAAHRHVPLTRDDQLLFSELLERCIDVPWILEAPPR